MLSPGFARGASSCDAMSEEISLLPFSRKAILPIEIFENLDNQNFAFEVSAEVRYGQFLGTFASAPPV